MLYQVSLSVPAGTSEKEPVEATIEIEEPYLVRIEVKFPPGPTHLVKVAVFYGRLQIFPSKRGEWITGDDEKVVDHPRMYLPHRPTRFRCVACSPQAEYPHTIYFRFEAAEEVVPIWLRRLFRFIDKLEKALRRLMGV